MRSILAALILPLLAAAAILPESIGSYKRTATSQPTLDDRSVWDEFGLKEWESAAYESGKKKLTATAWRLQDSTGALGVFDWHRPAKAKPSTAAKLAAETPTGLLIAHGNYLLSFEGYKPSAEEMTAVLQNLKNVDATSLPLLPGHLPAQGLIPNSERYIIGPAGLEKFAPAIPASVAAFRLGAEAALAGFRGPKGEATLVIFNYPTHQIAMQQLPEFEKIQGAYVRRSGPLLSVVLGSTDPNYAEILLGQVRFQAEITRDEYVPTARDNVGYLLVNGFVLIGLLLGFAIIAGLGFGAFRSFLRRGRKGEEAEAMIRLNLG